MANSNSKAEEGRLQAALIDDPEFLKGIVKEVIQEMLEIEMNNHVGALPYERTEARRGLRNGYKPRTLRTRVGTLNLLVPKDRDGTFSTNLFERYQRSEKALVLTLMEMYIQGVSTRKVTEITEALCGTSVSKSLVSQLSSRLDHEIFVWRRRPLSSHNYPYLFVDARYEMVRSDGRVTSQGALIVKGVRDDGKREILATDVTDTESEATYNALFDDLKNRGLSGVLLVVSDDHTGLVAAVKRHFQGASWQRCQVHFMRNLIGMVSRVYRRNLAKGLKEVFSMPDQAHAKEAAATLADVWRKSHHKVAEMIDETIEECFACYAFPSSHRVRIRTTNGLERLNQELKRRTRVIRIFPNRAACLRIITALCIEQSEEWTTGKCYLDMQELAASTAIKQEHELAAIM